MTEFTDIPEVNTLYEERMLVDSAITMIDAGGNMTFFTIEPKPLDPGMMPTGTQAPARITMPIPTPTATIDNIRAWLVQRQTDIDTQLASLGVTNPPAARV